MKRCSACRVEKPLEEFHRDHARPDGRQYTCKECKRARLKADYQRNREKRIAAASAYYYRNHDKARARARERYHRDPEKTLRAVRESYWRRKYGLTPETYEALFDSQGRVCAACGWSKPRGKNWHVDHCHSTNTVRGILCNNCNAALGMVEDSPERVLALYRYITKC